MMNNDMPRQGSGEMFDAIADRYDQVNRMISLGLDQQWRKKTVESLQLKPNDLVVDLATGTADLAIMIANMHQDVKVIGIDPSQKMLDVGANKISELELSIELRKGDAQSIELADKSVDALTIAFGIRNVPDRLLALKEMARVVKEGGRIAILELSEPKKGFFSAFARFHIHKVVPRLGRMFSGQKEYEYLQRSIAAFPPPEQFALMMEEAGLEIIEIFPFTFGVVCLFVATPRRTTTV